MTGRVSALIGLLYDRIANSNVRRIADDYVILARSENSPILTKILAFVLESIPMMGRRQSKLPLGPLLSKE